MKPDELLEYAAKDPATWSKDEVRRLLREAATAITKQQQDAERYRWLRQQGNREKAADMTLHRMNLDAAIDAEMAGANDKLSRAGTASA